MGMQVTTLLTGGNVTVPVQKEQKPLPMERKEASSQGSAFFSGTQKQQPPDLKQTTTHLEQISLAFNRRLKFEVDQDSKELIVKVIDNETDKVIKVLPPEELQRLHSKISETIGFLYDRTV